MTTITPQTAAGDLAFLRTLVDEQPKTYKNAGIIYSTAGLIYGFQCLANWVLLKGGGCRSKYFVVAFRFWPYSFYLLLFVSGCL